ncbi:hypothetical protein [Bacillus sp. 7894-2]|uniref:hypothetical protein n=1 Tax=Bacillus sp. 7894-2 TaxID=2021695 RepID=UPI000BA69641|nr:hypothetical protein [Bacillus sp. 7894-2]PAE23650.1 hypothetical protein CHI10_16950 [Bacillus sp. 7894-2]
MFKKTLVSLLSVAVLLSPVSNVFANSNGTQEITDKKAYLDSLKKEEKQSIEVRGEKYDVYQYQQADGSVRMEAHSPEGNVEAFKLDDNVLYDENGKKVATFNEEYVPESEALTPASKETDNEIGIMAYHESKTSPYPSSDYTINKGATYGNVQLSTNIKNMTTGALAVAIGVISTVLGTVISSMLIAIAIETDINAYAIFYKKQRWDHKSLGILAQEYFVTMYWDPNRQHQAGTTKKYYLLYS